MTKRPWNVDAKALLEMGAKMIASDIVEEALKEYEMSLVHDEDHCRTVKLLTDENIRLSMAFRDLRAYMNACGTNFDKDWVLSFINKTLHGDNK